MRAPAGLGQPFGVRWVTAGLFGFALCMTGAAFLYPGGHFGDLRADGYSFWRNYWCDLVDPTAMNGAPNVAGAWLARIGFLCFALALLRFWPLARAHAGHRPAARTAAQLGKLGALALMAVSFVPAPSWPVTHAVAVSLSAVAGIAAALVIMPALSAKTDRITPLFALGLAVSSGITLLQYLRQGITGRDYAEWLAGAQKVATFFLLAWMLRLLLQFARAERA